jgi:hypothetical protein
LLLGLYHGLDDVLHELGVREPAQTRLEFAKCRFRFPVVGQPQHLSPKLLNIQKMRGFLHLRNFLRGYMRVDAWVKVARSFETQTLLAFGATE